MVFFYKISQNIHTSRVVVLKFSPAGVNCKFLEYQFSPLAQICNLCRATADLSTFPAGADLQSVPVQFIEKFIFV
jgi:hypothetical protein